MIFINQVTTELFSDVIEILRQLPGPHFLIAGSASQHWDNIRYLSGCPLQRKSVFRRILTWTWFTVQVFFYLLRYARGQHIFFVTNPPMALWMAPFFKQYYGSTYSLLIYDIYPETFMAVRIISETSLFAKLWRRLNERSFQGAEHIITLGTRMAETLQAQMGSAEKLKISIIENWIDTEVFYPIPKAENPMGYELQLAEKFIVGYAGAFGAMHKVDMLLECAKALESETAIHFLLVGGGTREEFIQRLLREKSLPNVTLLPFQPRETFRYIAALPDLSVILTRAGSGHAMLPSKLYTALAVGSAVLAVADEGSDLARLVHKEGYGMTIQPGDVQAMTKYILFLSQNPSSLTELQKNARLAAVSKYSKTSQSRKYMKLFALDRNQGS